LHVLISELPQPLAVRRSVSFAEAVYAGQMDVEGIIARLVAVEQIASTLETGEIPVIVDPEVSVLTNSLLSTANPETRISVVVDARLTKHAPEPLPAPVELHIGLGPGFNAGENCHAVIETRRSHTLGRVYWRGSPQPDSGLPEGDSRRVLRAPADGMLAALVEIGDHVEEGQAIAEILTEPDMDPGQGDAPPQVTAPFAGVLRGLIHPGLHVHAGLKIGDVDPRDDPQACRLVSDKALAIGGGVLEALLSHHEVRSSLWG
jgi:xanthine dehydrogenase accessory factor